MRPLVLACVVALISGCGSTNPPLDDKPIAGCKVTVSDRTRTAFYEPLVIIKPHSNGTDYWVYFPMRDGADYVGVDGKERAVNLPIDTVLKVGEARIIRGVMCHCPTG